MALTGNKKWAVLLVSFKDSTTANRTRRPPSFYNELFAQQNQDGLQKYWNDISNFKMNISGTTVFPWRTIPFTLDEYKEFSRFDKIYKAAKAFSSTVNFKSFYGIIVIPDQNIGDAGSVTRPNMSLNGANQRYGTVLGNVDTYNANFYAHEMGHGFEIGHAWDDSTRQSAEWSKPGEYYDSYDVMGGAGANYMFDSANFGKCGPGLNAYYTSRAGWLNSSSILSLDANSSSFGKRYVILSGLNRYGEGGTRAIEIKYNDFNSGKPMSYWVEARLKADWNRNIPQNQILIRRVVDGRSTLINAKMEEERGGFLAGETFVDEKNDISIFISAIDNLGASIIVQRFSSTVQKIPDTIGLENQGAGIAITQLNTSSKKDLLFFYIENVEMKDNSPTGQNRAFLKVGYDLNFYGQPTSWSDPIQIPDWNYWENQGGDVATADISGSNRPDVILFYMDNPSDNNKAFYRVGIDMDVKGKPTSWKKYEIPGYYGGQNQGAGVAVADLNGNGKMDLIIMYVVYENGKNKAFYRVGRDMAADGKINIWSKPYQIPNWLSHENQGAGIALYDTDNSGKLDLVVFGVDNPLEGNHGFYVVGHNLNSEGIPESWGEIHDVRGWFGWENQGGSIAITDLTGDNKPEMLVMHIDNPNGQNSGHFRFIDHLNFD